MDWKKLILEIKSKHQMTQQQIAARCKCGQATINDLANGHTNEPRHSLGMALIALHESEKFAAPD